MRLSKFKYLSISSVIAIAAVPAISCAKDVRTITWNYSDQDFNNFTQNHDYVLVKNDRLVYAYDNDSAIILNGYHKINTSYVSYTKDQITKFYFDEADFLQDNHFGFWQNQPVRDADGKEVHEGGEVKYANLFDELQVDKTDTSTHKQPTSRYRKIKIMDENVSAPIEYTYFTKTDTIDKPGFYTSRQQAENPQIDKLDIFKLKYKADNKNNQSSTYNATFYTDFKYLLEDNKIQNYKSLEDNENNINGYWMFTKGIHNYFTDDVDFNESKKKVSLIPSELETYQTVKAPKNATLPALLMFFKAEKDNENDNKFNSSKAQIFRK